MQAISSRPLSLNDQNLKTCVFDPQFRIAHFPMYHYPPEGHYSKEDKENVAKSQFQLLHTLLDYNRSARPLRLFDENIIHDGYNEAYFQGLLAGQSLNDTYKKIDGSHSTMGAMLTQARSFQTGFPEFYEHLTPPQKDTLFQVGASLVLYLLGEIPQLHKVITPNSFHLAIANLRDINGNLLLKGNDYWLFDFREEELRKEVAYFFSQNLSFRGIVLIAYGANHDLSNEFTGHAFQSGHKFCLDWAKHSPKAPVILP